MKNCVEVSLWAGSQSDQARIAICEDISGIVLGCVILDGDVDGRAAAVTFGDVAEMIGDQRPASVRLWVRTLPSCLLDEGPKGRRAAAETAQAPT